MLPSQIKETFQSSAPLRKIVTLLNETQSVTITGTPGCSKAFLLAALFESTKRNLVCIFPGNDPARLFCDDLAGIIGEGNILFYPALHRQIWSEIGPLTSDIGRRLATLKSLLAGENKILVTTAQALAEKIAAPESVTAAALAIQVGKNRVFSSFIEQLVQFGFVREERVDRPGEMSVRGGIVDLFLYESPHPVRIEFWGDTVDSIRLFDVETQRSLQSLSGLLVLPCNAAGPYNVISEASIFNLATNSNLLDYLTKSHVLTFFGYRIIEQEIEDMLDEMRLRMHSFLSEHSGIQINFQEHYCDKNSLLSQFQNRLILDFATLEKHFPSVVEFGISEAVCYGGKLDLLQKHLRLLMHESAHRRRIVFFCDSMAQTERLKEIISHSEDYQFLSATLYEGFDWPEAQLTVLTQRDLFGRLKIPRLDKLEKRVISLRELFAIKYGDYVVHIDHGIGIFRGLKKITAYDRERECLALEYQDGDMLYVPLEKMDRVQKYSSKESAIPLVNKLGSGQWEKLKSRAKQKVKEIADKLIRLYAARKMRPGFAFTGDSVWQKELELSFEFDETPDQLSAIHEIKEDMEKPQPMDRLVCGDVGYGKTEVAIRAAFKAVNDGKQVAVLVPTTILAEQHYQTFKDRLEQFPVKIETLSRFKSSAQQKKVLNSLQLGQIDIIIGTHRLLSKDVHFRDLGLLVVDEEQRFGVLHKEKIKLLQASVDTLTLSATPIPRTMHMSLIGAKDLSIINTPPQNRLPIKTEVMRFDRDYLREIILREINRGGQVFFVHNRVQSIYGIAQLLRELVPEVSVAVAHGQMKSHELEKVMLAFTSGDIRCLVSTMIIESGIDMPNANTLIINRADKFGLAQLYQLRGRVGRSHQQAFAYLIVPPLKRLTRTAIKRLQTIQELSHLGAGYQIAMRDLEIRGTGNIFGAEQSGFVESLGYEMFAKIIQEAIEEIRDEMNLEPQERRPQEIKMVAKVEFQRDAFLPDDYVSSSAERVDLYKRLIDARDVRQVTDLREEVKDRFGTLPGSAQALFDYIILKLLCQQARIEKLWVKDNLVIGLFSKVHMPKAEQFRIWLGKMVAQADERLELVQEKHQVLFRIKLNQNDNSIEYLKNFLQRIA